MMGAFINTPLEVAEGSWKGHVIRRARKAGRCQYHPGKRSCRIEVGDLYLEGERSENAGGFASERYCIECASECEGVASALAKARGVGA